MSGSAAMRQARGESGHGGARRTGPGWARVPVLAVAGGRIYVFGGLDAEGRALASAEVCDPLTDTWATR